MPGVMQPLRDEHTALLPEINALREAADSISTEAPVRAGIEKNLDFLEHHLVPHALAEDEVLYPRVAELMGSERATDTMRRDHVAVGNLIAELRDVRDRIGDHRPSEAQASEARRLL